VTEVLLNLTEVFLTLTEVFPCFFLSCTANARVKLAKTGHGPHSSIVVVLFGCYVCCSMYCLCVNVYCHRVMTQLQLINISISISSM
jgi:magnesium-transporting ATPase (P-type)